MSNIVTHSTISKFYYNCIRNRFYLLVFCKNTNTQPQKPVLKKIVLQNRYCPLRLESAIFVDTPLLAAKRATVLYENAMKLINFGKNMSLSSSVQVT